MPETIAVYGGSFNPPHLAHQMACLAVLETQPVDRILMVPCHRHAFGKPLAPYEDRVEMCRLAAALFGGLVEVSTIESELGEGENRTFHTLTALRAREPDASFRLLVGADVLDEKDSWYRWDEVVAMAPLIVVGREGVAAGAGLALQLPAISSTEVRARLARGEGAEPLVPRSVLDYIAGRGLYR
ncbi:MAG TPA: nicotinate-nicotinamide nucleotide adenylyltransferase [Kofleriaceae bacterium]|nr:nicotinate-nicotinamide nucleotide adenylyltransferase [Kofleriaceae bacterium]